MKKLIFISALFFTLHSCYEIAIPEETTKQKAVSNTKQDSTIQIVFVADRSKSFVENYTYPDPALFKPLCDHISATSKLDFRYGCITSNSNIVFSRYAPPLPEQASEENSNVWLDKKPKKEPAHSFDSDWNNFSAEVNNRLSANPSNSSDIATIIKRSLLAFGERNGRKVLLISSDFDDSFTKDFPSIPQDIDVITVGVLPDTPVKQILHTDNVRPFETLHSALEYLLSTF